MKPEMKPVNDNIKKWDNIKPLPIYYDRLLSKWAKEYMEWYDAEYSLIDWLGEQEKEKK